MTIVITPATRQVTASTWSNGSPSGARSGIPAKLRICGFTKMMYDITMKVVTPAIVSRASVVPCSAKRNRRSRNDDLCDAAISAMSSLLLQWTMES